MVASRLFLLGLVAVTSNASRPTVSKEIIGMSPTHFAHIHDVMKSNDESTGGGRCSRLELSGSDEIRQADPNLNLQYVQSGSSCECVCQGPQCFECTPPGQMQTEEDGAFSCVAPSQMVSQDDLVERTENACGTNGKLSKSPSGKAMCVVPNVCPTAPSGNGFKARKTSTDCSCSYELECEEQDGMQLETVVDGSALVCKHRRPPKEVDGEKLGPASCVQPLVLRGSDCVLTQPCPRPVTLSQMDLACGPHTSGFIAKMFEEMIRKQDAASQNARQTSCMANCVSVFAKMSECYTQDIATCVGGDVVSTRGKPASDYVEPDRADDATKDWLVKSQADTKGVPCHNLFASARSFSSTTGDSVWGEIVQNLEKSAEEHYIDLQGDYATFPAKPISCRDGFCKKIFTMRPAGSVKTLKQCEAHCIESQK